MNRLRAMEQIIEQAIRRAVAFAAPAAERRDYELIVSSQPSELFVEVVTDCDRYTFKLSQSISEDSFIDTVIDSTIDMVKKPLTFDEALEQLKD